MAKKEKNWWQKEMDYCREMMQYPSQDNPRNDEDVRKSDWYEDVYTDILKRKERDL